MPNWVHNIMKVTGAADEIARFKQSLTDNHFDFWTAYDPASSQYFKRDEPDCLELCFDTAGSPPVTVWEKMGEMFPTLEFELEACEPINDEAYRGTIRRGHMELHYEPLIWETADPKTGETISGTREEIDRMLGLYDRPAPVLKAKQPEDPFTCIVNLIDKTRKSLQGLDPDLHRAFTIAGLRVIVNKCETMIANLEDRHGEFRFPAETEQPY